MITIQKILQDQYTKDFSDVMEVLKGRANYPCDYDGLGDNAEIDAFMGVTTCDIAPCKAQERPFFDECLLDHVCQYFNAIKRCQDVLIVNFNFQSWLNNILHTDRFGEKNKRRRLLILDECHNVETQLMNFISYTFSDRDMPWKLPKLATAPEYVRWLDENNYKMHVQSQVSAAKASGKIKAFNRWQNKLRGWEMIKSLVKDEAFIAEDPTRDKTHGNTSVELKPLYVRRFFPKIFDADVVFMMSATVLNHTIVSESLGLNPQEVSFVRMPSTFPKENRPLYFNPVGPMTFKYVRDTTPRMVEAVQHYLEHYKDVRGIIHCHSFKLGDQIYEGLTQFQRARILYQRDPKIARTGDPRMEILARLESKPNAVILAPAFHEGVDLKDDLSRFQLICKVPYPDVRSSRQLAARTDTKQGGDFRYYMWLTALKTVQSVGRSVRTPKDSAITHILDEDFKKFVDRTRSMLPEWFMEALIFNQQ
jgi:Rad3-related DNA helicase